ncbi:MAG: choice-of-anchor Q domain-containing protein [Chloroflexota bacterium]
MLKHKNLAYVQFGVVLSFALMSLLLIDSARSSPLQHLAYQSENLCAPLAAPTGTIVNVSTVTELQNAVNSAAPNTTILIADGTYELNGVYLRIDEANVTLRSASGNRKAVMLDGNYQTTEIIQVVRSNVTIADITLREAYYHPIHVMSTDAGGDVLNTLIYNVHIIDPGEQAIKINKAGDGVYTDDGVIACSKIELTDTGRPFIRNNCYTGGIDAHQSRNWHIRDNHIEGFWCDSGLSEHAVHFWRGSRDTLVERNVLVDNARGIGFGLVTSGSGRTFSDACPAAGSSYVDHFEAVARNNFIAADDADLFNSNSGFDCGICVWNACGVDVYHNTVASSQAPFSSIEWRFDNTEATIINNLVTHSLRDRGGQATVSSNLENQPLSIFVDWPSFDLHLNDSAVAAIDQASTSVSVSDDIDGVPRPIGGAPDIGADEYGESTPTPTPTIDPNFVPSEWVYIPYVIEP